MMQVTCDACDGQGHIIKVKPDSLREVREKAGVSLRAMAKLLGFTPPYISDIERGRRNCTPKILKAYDKL